MDIGVFPWWTDPTLKAEFLQALTVLTHRLDYALWPDSPVLMHAQSLFWLGTAVAAVAVFYRRMLGPTGVAATAALLYAIDDAARTDRRIHCQSQRFDRGDIRRLGARFATIAGGAGARGRPHFLAPCSARGRCSPRKRALALVLIWRPTVSFVDRAVAGEVAWRCRPMSALSSPGGQFAITGVTAFRTWAFMLTR